jgi:hypothetical protein
VPPLLLLDENGHVRTELGVPKDETWILAFDAGGQQRLVEKGQCGRSRIRRLHFLRVHEIVRHKRACSTIDLC